MKAQLVQDLQSAKAEDVKTRRLIVPPGCDVPIRQEKRNIFDPTVCKGIIWDADHSRSSGDTGANQKLVGTGSGQCPKTPEGADVIDPQPVQPQMTSSGAAVPAHVKAALEAARTGCWHYSSCRSCFVIDQLQLLILLLVKNSRRGSSSSFSGWNRILSVVVIAIAVALAVVV